MRHRGNRREAKRGGDVFAGHPKLDAMGLVGRSSAVRALLKRVGQAARSEATVLILGERGTGKELVARAVAGTSARPGGPFIAVNCAALPVDLLASELFGYERGAFTGAAERRQGLLASAHTGTVFLDEIGDLSLPAQTIFLRFLQEREVRPLGAAHPMIVDVRVIAATNQDLEHAASSTLPCRSL